MRSRTIAIGDVHGCARALAALLKAIEPRREDTIVTLGDYVNRGPDSRGVLEQLIALERQCTLIPLLGNHDQTLLEARAIALADDVTEEPRAEGDRTIIADWIRMGGDATLVSYGAPRGRVSAADLARIPAQHCEFLGRCRDYHETSTHIFVHAQYDPGMAMDKQFSHNLRWHSLKSSTPGPHGSGKKVIVGHSAQKTGEILDLGHVECIDTYCFGGGWLTALDVDTEEIWQANKQGGLRQARS
jgi:serine/threonine protein phosphatase 1